MMQRFPLILYLSFLIVLCMCSCQNEDSLSVFVQPNYQQGYSQEALIDIEGDATDFISPDLNVADVVSMELMQEIYDSVNDTIWNYNVILPPSYFESETSSYPVFYILHGLGSGPENEYNGFRLNKLLDYCYLNEIIPEMIVVLPDCKDTYWVDDYIKGKKYETFFMNQLVPELEYRYRVDTSLKRYIFGFSMGGYGAAHYAFSYPDMFGYCYSASGTLMGKGGVETPSVLATIQTIIDKDLPYFTIDIGLNDNFLTVNRKAHEGLIDLDIQHEYIEREGKHDWTFWRGSLYACLLRIGRLYYEYNDGFNNAGIHDVFADN